MKKIIEYWIETNDAIDPHPKLDGLGAEDAPYVRVFTNAHGFALGALAAVFWGKTKSEAKENASRFLSTVKERE